ncbi:larval cuticle protein LCP-17-like [Helicoverpa zea]|uniref:larval cuticle protein LCP-17-like n=1 Tax=Helicoverpa zea TaxID=7113 RepID=UPI001F574B82|nr:larval cuticle protein LCP-17-like [Helicoverpa zea]
MKFLVLALCVAAASAASYGSGPFGVSGFQKYNNYKTYEAPAAAPVVVSAKAVASAAGPVLAPVAAPVQAANAVYSAAKTVVNKPYQDAEAAILRSENDVSPDGYKYFFETNNGIVAEAVGTTKQVGDSVAVVSQGTYRYVAPDGTPVEIVYTADENGYQPQGAVLPVAPPVPEAILRSIAYNAAHASLKKN